MSFATFLDRLLFLFFVVFSTVISRLLIIPSTDLIKSWASLNSLLLLLIDSVASDTDCFNCSYLLIVLCATLKSAPEVPNDLISCAISRSGSIKFLIFCSALEVSISTFLFCVNLSICASASLKLG